MTNIDKKKLSQLKTFRLISVTMPLLSAIVRFLIFHKVLLYDFQFVLMLSCSAILMLPFFLENSGMVLTLVALTLSWDFVDIAATALSPDVIHKLFHTILYALVLILPLQICILVSVRSKVWDEGYLAATVSGWDSAMGYLRISFALIYQPLAISSIFIAHISSVPKFIPIVLFVLASLFFLFLYIRSMTSIKWLYDDRNNNISRNVDIVFTPESRPCADSSQNMLFERMCTIMKVEKLFLSPTFTVEELSRALFTNRGYLSRMINSCTGMNFNTLINNYRVRHAMELFKTDPKMKVSDLIGMSGFNNPVTFNNAFKLVMKMTPGEWCNSYKEKLRARPKETVQGEKAASSA